MPDFSDAKYASYVELCRELDILRSLSSDKERIVPSEGDWFWHEDWRSTDPVILMTGEGYPAFDVERDFWLLQLHDWREMLEEAGYSAILIHRHLADDDASSDYDGYEAMAATDASFAPGELGPNTEGPAVTPTAEEAAARLWMAVKS